MRWSTGILLVLGCVLMVPEPAEAQRGRRAAQALGAARGEMLAQACFSCHGPRGASIAAAVPSIGGQGAVYLVTSMTRFKDDTRPASVMNRIAKGYTDPEIMEIAQYLSKLEFKRDGQLTDAQKVELGAKPYQEVCSECHLNDGREVEIADYPVLAGQRLMYMQMQMHQINEKGTRKVDSKFTASISRLSKEEIEAVLHYFASQR